MHGGAVSNRVPQSPPSDLRVDLRYILKEEYKAEQVWGSLTLMFPSHITLSVSHFITAHISLQDGLCPHRLIHSHGCFFDNGCKRLT